VAEFICSADAVLARRVSGGPEEPHLLDLLRSSGECGNPCIVDGEDGLLPRDPLRCLVRWASLLLGRLGKAVPTRERGSKDAVDPRLRFNSS